LIQPAGVPAGEGGGLPVQKEGSELLVRPQASSGDVWALLVETP
jgi:hypothetical protein